MYDLGAEHSIDEIYHTWFYDGTDWDNAQTSLYGPAPGFVPGGPNQGYSANTSLQPPYNQPAQKSYLDWNTGFPQNSWEVTEPAIYYQASALRLLASINADLPLPVEWLGNPRVELKGKDVLIKWFTSAEWFNEKFIIEHSLDGKSFEPIGTVHGANNSDITQSYHFRHRHAPTGLNYYRIKQIDFDGAFQYSPVMSIIVERKKSIQLYPNPVSTRFMLSGEMSDYLVAVFDRNGVKVQSFQFTGSGKNCDVSDLNAGIYMVRVVDLQDRSIDVLRFLKM